MSIFSRNTSASRREFIGQLGMVAVAVSPLASGCAAASRSRSRKCLVGSNIFGWGQYAQRDQRQLDVNEVISALRDAGYDYLENFMNVGKPEENGRFADQLKAKGLQPVSLYVGGALHDAAKAQGNVENILNEAKVCRQAGFTVISRNPDPIGREKTDEELKTQRRRRPRTSAGYPVSSATAG